MYTERMFAAVPAKADRENNCWLPLWVHLVDTVQTVRFFLI